MAEPTEADRERADDVARQILNGKLMQSAVRATIAQALADERERARAPFLALAEEIMATPTPLDAIPTTIALADRIHRAAEGMSQ